ncbi:MAG: 3-dehydroquinate synthase [Gammaproteobacteria bacterium]|nr:MAG: 3-dehydroquinate synthase [Gammaproteobacteria bacterium]
MNTFDVQLGKRSYPIYIGEDLLTQPQHFLNHTAHKNVFIISNEKVAPLYLDKVLDSCKKFNCEFKILPDGEQHKNINTMETIYSSLLEQHCDRSTTLIALGGGVIGDITGFAAATYQRGVHFIQVPTTLLAQVDSSVGGKTGVNHALGKNMIGCFYQPRCVIADLSTLNTLDERELSAGIAEIIKYGLIRDPEFFIWLEKNMSRLIARDLDALAYAVHRSCENKAQIVAEDELEQSGKRALLNYGHTFGHAIETGTGYGNWLHGEAVACGMLMAARLSIKQGWLSKQDYSRIETIIKAANLPTRTPDKMTVEDFINLMSVDKKVRDGRLYLVLLNKIGEAVLTANLMDSTLEETLREYCNE